MRKASRKPRSTLPRLQSLMEIPPAAQLASGKAMKWRDPSDVTPSATRTARTIKGWRSGDPLRACRQRHGDACGITERHILAADRLRRYADGARIGFSIERDLSLPVTHIIYRPSTGPGRAALEQAECWRNFVRAMPIAPRSSGNSSPSSCCSIDHPRSGSRSGGHAVCRAIQAGRWAS